SITVYHQLLLAIEPTDERSVTIMCSDGQRIDPKPRAPQGGPSYSDRRTAHNRGLSRIGEITDQLGAGCVGGEIPAHQVRDTGGVAGKGGGGSPRPPLA